MFRWMKRSPQIEHEFCQENLSPFLDKQLTSSEQARVTRHLQECPACRADLQSLRQTVALLRATPVLKPPRTFFIPASEGVRQRHVQRSRLAYGYLQFATAVATVLLVLVVSGDALLRLGVARPARQVTAPNVEITASGRGGELPEAMPTAAAEPQTGVSEPEALAAVPPPPAAPTAVTMLAAAPLPDEASQTEAAQALVDSQALGAKAAPSHTFARPAGAPPLPTATQEGKMAASAVTETGQSELGLTSQVELTAAPATLTQEPTQTSVPPTATPLPTETPVPPTATPAPTETPVPPTATPVPPVEEPSPPPAQVDVGRQALPPPDSAGRWESLQAVQPLLPWLEGALGALVAVLLVVTLWLRRKQRMA
jgi:anti-sigma factor RsiW